MSNSCNWNYILFTKLPWPGDSEGTFRSSSQAATCLPVYYTRWWLHTVPLIAERQAGKPWTPIFIVFSWTRPGIEPESTAAVADTLSTRPLIGSTLFHWDVTGQMITKTDSQLFGCLPHIRFFKVVFRAQDSSNSHQVTLLMSVEVMTYHAGLILAVRRDTQCVHAILLTWIQVPTLHVKTRQVEQNLIQKSCVRDRDSKGTKS